MFIARSTEILEAFSSSPVPATTTEFTTTQISTVSGTIGQQFSGFTTVHHTSSVSSVKHTTSGIDNVPQLLQGVLCVKYLL